MTRQNPQTIEPDLKQSDDFKAISGIKQGIESRLHNGGIHTYEQLAALTPEEILTALGKVIGYTRQRIVDENWTGQAVELARNKQRTEETMVRQHYATFTVELLLGKENTVRRTHMVHIQTGSEETWAGWSDQRLTSFISESAGVQLVNLSHVTASVDLSAPIEQAEPEPLKIQPRLSGSPRIREVAIIAGVGERHRVLGDGQPFDIEISVDLDEVTGTVEGSLSYRMIVSAKELGRGRRLVLGDSQGTWNAGETGLAHFGISGLPCGMYRISVDLAISASTSITEPDLSAIFEGGLIKVY